MHACITPVERVRLKIPFLHHFCVAILAIAFLALTCGVVAEFVLGSGGISHVSDPQVYREYMNPEANPDSLLARGYCVVRTLVSLHASNIVWFRFNGWHRSFG